MRGEEVLSPLYGRCLIRVLSSTIGSLEPDDAGQWLLELLEIAQSATSPKLILEDSWLFKEWFLLRDLSPKLRDSILWVPPPKHRPSQLLRQVASGHPSFLHPDSVDIRRYMT